MGNRRYIFKSINAGILSLVKICGCNLNRPLCQLKISHTVCSPTTAQLHCDSSLQYLLDSLLQEK